MLSENEIRDLLDLCQQALTGARDFGEAYACREQLAYHVQQLSRRIHRRLDEVAEWESMVEAEAAQRN